VSPCTFCASLARGGAQLSDFCTSNSTLWLPISGDPDGQYSVRVVATDAAGNVDPTVAVVQWTRDTVAPDSRAAVLATGLQPGSFLNVPLTEGPALALGSTYNVSSVLLTLAHVLSLNVTCSEPCATVLVAVDGTPVVAAATPWGPTRTTFNVTLPAVNDGLHLAHAACVDLAGFVDGSPAPVAVMVQSQSPVTQLVAPPTPQSSSPNVTFSLGATGEFLSAPVRFQLLGWRVVVELGADPVEPDPSVPLPTMVVGGQGGPTQVAITVPVSGNYSAVAYAVGALGLQDPTGVPIRFVVVSGVNPSGCVAGVCCRCGRGRWEPTDGELGVRRQAGGGAGGK
jgi:hypothetical protein